MTHDAHGGPVRSRVEDLQALARMLDAGEITRSEYETVKAELIAAPASDWEIGAETVAEPAETEPAGGPVEAGHRAESSPKEPAETTEAEPDLTDGDGSLLDRIRGMPRPYLYGAAAALLVLFIALFLLGGEPPTPVAAAPDTPTPDSGEPPADSLGIRLEDLGDAWNALDLPPVIRTGFSVTPEAGPLDAFLYRFDEASVIAGAYHPDDGYVRALMVRSGLFHPALGNLYVHLCHLLHPNDQGCLDSYIAETGVYGATAAEFADVDLSASWFYGPNRWSFTLEDNVQTIRVQAPGQG